MNQLNQILDETERIEKLNLDSLKGLWVKQFMWKGYRDSLLKQASPSQGNPLMSDRYENNLHLLKDAERNYGLGTFILNNSFNHDIKKLVRENPENVVEILFEEFSKNYSDKKLKELITDKIKSLVNGSCGLGITKILRGSIENAIARQSESDINGEN